MIAFEIIRNGKRICIAGAEDLCVLTANITAAGKLGKKTVYESLPDAAMPEVLQYANLAAMLLAYGLLTHVVKVWFIRRWGL